MLTKLLSLHVVDEIFIKDAQIKLGVATKMLYINCITHHFKNVEPTLPNLNDFHLVKAAIPNHHKFQKEFDQLCKSGLVVDHTITYKFVSHWIKYVELSRLNLLKEESAQRIDLSKYESEFYNSEQLIELVCMKTNLNKSQVRSLVKQFISEQAITDKSYSNIGDAKRHFIYWALNNKDKIQTENIVKSKGKILGGI